jgi:heterodisulfide reductase subunit C
MVRTRINPSSNFAQELASMPGGEVLNACISCGVCTASCAIASNTSQVHPRQIIQRILVGARESVLNSEQLWLCKTCHMCQSTCQYDVSLSDVFRVARKLAIKEGFVPSQFKDAAKTILTDGWLLKKAYSDHIADERKKLGLSSRLTHNKKFTDQVNSKYFDNGG